MSLLKSMKGQESSDGVTPDHCGGGDDNLTTLRANSSIHNFSLDGEWEGGGGGFLSSTQLIDKHSWMKRSVHMLPCFITCMG